MSSEMELQRFRRYFGIAIGIRFLAIAGVLVAVFSRIGEMSRAGTRLILFAAGIELFVNLVYLFTGSERWPRSVFHLTGLLDIAAIGTLVATTGGASSEFIAFYALVIVFNGTYYGWVGAATAAIPSTISLAMAAVLSGESISTERLVLEIAVFAALGFLAGKVGEGEQADRTRLREEALDADRQAHQNLALYQASVTALEDSTKRGAEATALFELARELSVATHLDRVLARVAEAGSNLLHVDLCAVALLNDSGSGIDPALGAIALNGGSPQATIANLASVAVDQMTRAMRERRPLEIDNPADLQPEGGPAEIAALGCYLIVPIMSGERPLGILCLGYKDSDRKFTIEQMQLGEAVAGLAAAATGNVRRHRTLQEKVSELKELDRLKTEFVSTASHELRSPLTSISGFTSTLLRHGPKLTEEERMDFLTIINQQAKQLTRLIDELLTVSRIEQGRLSLSFQRVDVAVLAVGCIAAARAKTDRHEIVSVFPSSFPPVVADEGKVNDILTNLIDNAIKYSPAGGRVEVGGKTANREVVVWVRDEGVGIADADLPKVFEKFYQIQGRPSAPGSGLGLYIVSQLVEAHDGRLWVESLQGEGTTFFFALPQRRATDLLSVAAEGGR